MQVPQWVVPVFFAFWAFSFLLDVSSTISCKSLVRFEKNLLFRFLVKRFGASRAVPFQAAAEAGLGVMMGWVSHSMFGMSSIGTIFLVFGIAHMTAWHSNKKFLARYGLGI